MSGFNFEETAAEMESAALQYEPENAMEILAMVESLPAALTSVANVMRVLAERSDSEFPLEKEIADGFNDIFGAVIQRGRRRRGHGPDVPPGPRAGHRPPRGPPQRARGREGMERLIMTTNTQASTGPVWDWSAGHGPVTGALSATTGAFALATTGAATGMPPGWALAAGTAGALGHAVAALRMRSMGRTIASRAASWLVAGGWTTWAMATGPLTWAAIGSLATIGIGIGVAARNSALWEEARELEEIAAAEREIARELSAERRAIAAEWVDRVQRVCGVTVRVLAVEFWPTGTGFTIDAALPAGGTTWDKIAGYTAGLSADARLPHGCTASASQGIDQGRVLIDVTTVNVLVEERDYPERLRPAVHLHRYPVGLPHERRRDLRLPAGAVRAGRRTDGFGQVEHGARHPRRVRPHHRRPHLGDRPERRVGRPALGPPRPG